MMMWWEQEQNNNNYTVGGGYTKLSRNWAQVEAGFERKLSEIELNCGSWSKKERAKKYRNKENKNIKLK